MNNKRERTILLSVMIVTLCMMLLVAGTYALFTDNAKLVNHLQAGNLNLKLERVGLTGNYLDEKGYLKELSYSSSDIYHHYFDGDSTDIFNTKDELVAPGFYREVTLRLGHEGVNDQEGLTETEYKEKYGQNGVVAFNYWLELRLDSTITDNWKDLASQLKITICTSDDNENYSEPLVMTAHSLEKEKSTTHLYEDLEGQAFILIGSDSSPIGTVSVGDNEYFKVKVEFENKGFSFNKNTGTLSSENDKAQSQRIGFDLIVYATQFVNQSIV